MDTHKSQKRRPGQEKSKKAEPVCDAIFFKHSSNSNAR